MSIKKNGKQGVGEKIVRTTSLLEGGHDKNIVYFSTSKVLYIAKGNTVTTRASCAGFMDYLKMALKNSLEFWTMVFDAPHFG